MNLKIHFTNGMSIDCEMDKSLGDFAEILRNSTDPLICLENSDTGQEVIINRDHIQVIDVISS